MDPVFLSRLLFAITIGFHFIFPPITIGMGWLIFGHMTRYKKTGEEADKQLVRFWTKLFAITFCSNASSVRSNADTKGSDSANANRSAKS